MQVISGIGTCSKHVKLRLRGELENFTFVSLVLFQMERWLLGFVILIYKGFDSQFNLVLFTVLVQLNQGYIGTTEFMGLHAQFQVQKMYVALIFQFFSMQQFIPAQCSSF